jgi:hypothetical protein
VRRATARSALVKQIALRPASPIFSTAPRRVAVSALPSRLHLADAAFVTAISGREWVEPWFPPGPSENTHPQTTHRRVRATLGSFSYCYARTTAHPAWEIPALASVFFLPLPWLSPAASDPHRPSNSRAEVFERRRPAVCPSGNKLPQLKRRPVRLKSGSFS